MQDAQEVADAWPPHRVIRYVCLGVRHGFPNLHFNLVFTVGYENARFGVYSRFRHLLSWLTKREYTFGCGRCRKKLILSTHGIRIDNIFSLDIVSGNGNTEEENRWLKT